MRSFRCALRHSWFCRLGGIVECSAGNDSAAIARRLRRATWMKLKDKDFRASRGKNCEIVQAFQVRQGCIEAGGKDRRPVCRSRRKQAWRQRPTQRGGAVARLVSRGGLHGPPY